MLTIEKEATMYAAVDLGSNSFRLHIGKHDGEAIRVLKSMREPIRLAAGLDAKGCLTEAAMQSALACLRSFRAALAGYRLEAVRVVATSAMRVARNGQAFLPELEAAIGHPIEIISGEEEGRTRCCRRYGCRSRGARRRSQAEEGAGQEGRSEG